MRKYIRHHADVPIEYRLLGTDHDDRNVLKNISQGGLCFTADRRLQPGADIHIRIPLQDPPFEVVGTVRWCKLARGGYEVGVEFSDAAAAFSVRMVEQVCHIERYRAEVLKAEGRILSGEQAAAEWIQRYAKDFPG